MLIGSLQLPRRTVAEQWFPGLNMLKSGSPRPFMDGRWKPTVELAPDCPRCNSSNTKFCYYNNYSLTQPRYFCKSCRRYWTKGGSLRNVPVGGGCRKNRRGKSVRVTGSLGSGCSMPDSNQSTSDPLVNWGRSEPENLFEDNHGSTIDLALVYAKFLNHENQFHINQDSGSGVPEIPNEFELPFDLSNTHNQFLHQHTMVQCDDYSGLDPKCENYIRGGHANHVLLGEIETNQCQEQQQRTQQQSQQQQLHMNSDVINHGFQAISNDGVLQDIFMSSLPLPQQPLSQADDNPPLYPNFSDLFSPF